MLDHRAPTPRVGDYASAARPLGRADNHAPQITLQRHNDDHTKSTSSHSRPHRRSFVTGGWVPEKLVQDCGMQDRWENLLTEATDLLKLVATPSTALRYGCFIKGRQRSDERGAIS